MFKASKTSQPQSHVSETKLRDISQQDQNLLANNSYHADNDQCHTVHYSCSCSCLYWCERNDFKLPQIDNGHHFPSIKHRVILTLTVPVPFQVEPTINPEDNPKHPANYSMYTPSYGSQLSPNVWPVKLFPLWAVNASFFVGNIVN